MVLTGMRVGEAAALKLDDISENYIRIDETYDNGRHSFDDPKGAVREIFIQDELRSFLKQISIIRKERMMQYGIRDVDLIFMTPHGKPISTTLLNTHLKVVSKCINKSITSHAFRHTHISLLAADGVSLEAISRRVGHSDTKITKAIYLHVTEKLRERDNMEIKNIKIG